MPLKKLLLRPGVNRENTRYTTEGGWYDCDKIRFRQGTPEKIGGWQQLSGFRFAGVCRSLLDWVTLGGDILTGVGTNVKFYIERGTQFFDITPVWRTTTAGAITFTATTGSRFVTVNETAHTSSSGDYVVFSGAVSLGGVVTAPVLNREYEIIGPVTANSYTIDVGVSATSSDSGTGGTGVVGSFLLPSGLEAQAPVVGWGANDWGFDAWGNTASARKVIRLWSQSNFGEDLLFAPRGGNLYYWDATNGVGARAVNVATMLGASDVPTKLNTVLVSDVSRFVLCFGATPAGSSTIDPMLIRWSDQENFLNWTPAVTNQAGDLRLSTGSRIVTALQMRQEILVWTDAAVYSLQYQGPPFVWGAQTLADNVSILGPNAKANAAGTAFWMGTGTFYKYDGRVQTLRCDLRQYIFQDINLLQNEQIFASTVESFNEVWWFYPTADSMVPNRYVVYNYAEDIWYYGQLERTAWIDSKLSSRPVAAYRNRLVEQETGVDDNSDSVTQPITAFVDSSDFDLEDGQNIGFIWRVLPDITFRGSTADNPSVTMTMRPLLNAGSGYNTPLSVGGSAQAVVARTAVVPVEQFTGQVYVRVRGRQMTLRLESSGLGVNWQLGSPRIDIRLDGRR
jgi:hypothetical protein